MKKTITLGALATFTASALLPIAAFAQDSSGTVSATTTFNTDETVQAPVPGSKPLPIRALHIDYDTTGSSSEKMTPEDRGNLKAHVQGEKDMHEENRVEKSDSMINARIAALNKLSARLNSEKHLTVEQKATLSASLAVTIAEMTALEAKINSESGSSTAADKASITKDYRVYALVLPQASIEAAADRELDVVAQMQTLGAKLQTRIAAMKAKGMNTTAQDAAYADFTAKLSAAQVSANAAASAVAGLKPDGGDKTIAASNTVALKSGRTYSKSAEASLKAARADVNVIVKASRMTNEHPKMNGTVNATTSATVH